MIDSPTKDRITWWALKAKQQRDPFIKFILYWFCFNSWISYLSNKDNDRQAINWFIDNESCLKKVTENFWQSSQTQAIQRNLQNLGPVYDMRPNYRNRKTEIKNINDVGQVINYIYQIRCNLFHGSKSPIEKRDQNLVELSSIVLEKWIEWANVKC